jgi:hypothetical protein
MFLLGPATCFSEALLLSISLRLQVLDRATPLQLARLLAGSPFASHRETVGAGREGNRGLGLELGLGSICHVSLIIKN